MRGSSLKKEILKKLDNLPFEEQRKVLDFTQHLAMARTVGVHGRELLPFAGTIEKADLELMQHAIEKGCERVDLNEW